MVNILTSTQTIIQVLVRTEVPREIEQVMNTRLGLKLKKTLSQESFDEQSKYLDAATIASFISLNPIDQKHKYRSNINLQAINNDTFNFSGGSSSSGLGYSLALFTSWWQDILKRDIPKNYPIFATGEVSKTGEIFEIGFIEEKLQSVCNYIENHRTLNAFYICYPTANDSGILESTKQKIKSLGGVLICASSFQSLLEKLIGDTYDGNPNSRWEPFKGIQAYKKPDAIRFFGRESLTDKIIEEHDTQIRPHIYLFDRLSGKTSLINAGLKPKFEDNSVDILYLSDFHNATDVYIKIAKFVSGTTSSVQKIEFDDYQFIEEKLTPEKVRNIGNLSAGGCIQAGKAKSVIVDDFHLLFNTDSDVYTNLLLAFIDTLSSINVKFLFFSNKDCKSMLERKILPMLKVEMKNVESFSLKKLEVLLQKQVDWAGYKFEIRDGKSLANRIVDDLSQYHIPIVIMNFLLSKLYDIANLEHTKVFTFESYDRLNGLPGICVNYYQLIHLKDPLNESFFNVFFESFYMDSVQHPTDEVNDFQFEKYLKVGLVQYDAINKQYLGNKLVYASALYSEWKGQSMLNWFVRTRTSYLEWKNQYKKQSNYDVRNEYTRQQAVYVKNIEERNHHNASISKEIDKDLDIGFSYFLASPHMLSFDDMLIGRKLVKAKLVSDINLIRYIYLSKRYQMTKHLVRFGYIVCAIYLGLNYV
jgi:hypothetical protein